MRLNSFFSKLIIIFTVLALTYLYARYEKEKYYLSGDNVNNEFVLKKLPNFNSTEIISSKSINTYDFLKGANGLFVHIWGTWCGPCEKEMPDFLKYAESVKGKGIKFLLVAVNDDPVKVKKFIARYTLPENVTVSLDSGNVAMDLFDTLKVPETFLFNSTGKHINKFVGPQEWTQESYQTRLDFWLTSKNLIERKIEIQ